MSLITNGARFLLFGPKMDARVTLANVAKCKGINLARGAFGMPPLNGPGFIDWLIHQAKMLWALVTGRHPDALPLPDDLPVALFNVVNDLILQMVCRYFAFGHESSEQLRVMADAAVGLMFGAIKPLGGLLATLPVGPDAPGLTAGANFQLAYRANFLLPHRRVAWMRFAERLDEAATFAGSVEGPPEVRQTLQRVAAALEKTLEKLVPHIEDV